ncbi:MAG: hypothetical protein WCT13_03370 [Patescibacteria group bacterium]
MDNDQNPLTGNSGEEKFQNKNEKKSMGEIHTIPARFHSGVAKTKGKSKKNLPLIIIGAVALMLVLGVLAAFMFQKIMGDKNTNIADENQNQAVLNQNTNIANQNGNTNANLNENTNSQNSNSNLNINSNQNQNSNLNTNSGTTLNTNTTIVNSRDTDRDDLTDAEEEAFGTEPNKPDTDSDRYSDGIEVGSGYNPDGVGKISEMTTIGEYINKTFNYKILYPLSWIAQATDQTNKEVLFTSSLAEFVEVLVANNPSSQTAKEWYLAQYPELDSQTVTSFETWKGKEGVIGIDGKTVYLATDDNIYIITYNYGTRTEASFRKTFEMMYESFEITQPSSTNSNTNISNTNISNVNTSNTNTGNVNS